jgi:hypothetical protein
LSTKEPRDVLAAAIALLDPADPDYGMKVAQLRADDVLRHRGESW